jgi:hypothetical protein
MSRSDRSSGITVVVVPALVAVGASCLLAGCIQIEEAQPRPTTAVEVIDEWLAFAREEGKASARQLEILENARQVGEVTRAALDEATADYLACMEDAGIEYILVEEESPPGSGVYLPGVMIPAPDPDSNREIDISDACQSKHQMYVFQAYGNRPEAIEAEDRMWTGQEMRECLASRGYPSDPDATADEMRQLAGQDIVDHGEEPDFRPCVG